VGALYVMLFGAVPRQAGAQPRLSAELLRFTNDE